MNKEKIDEILSKHSKLLNNTSDGERIVLMGADLRGADLRDTDLRGADLIGADLRDTDLRDTDLRGADLIGADLIGAVLRGADLRGAVLRGADLRGADLRGADLIGAVLRDTDLRGADLRDTDLRDTDLRGADLRGADLIGADLRDTEIFYPITCPEKSSFIGFKKANKYVIELEITESALRSSATTRKCRCSEAKVISITNIDGTPCDVKSVASEYDNSFIYTVGSTVKADNFDTNRWNECAPGIHFFITREEAVRY